jgi:23S rRNA (adenine2503-C2)-methyltransferase
MIQDLISKHNLPIYRETQFNESFYKHAITSFDELTSWPKDLREKLKEEVQFCTLTEVTQLKSDNSKTIKILFKSSSTQKLLETVLMRHRDGRNTVCVSCMIGCPVNCTFCATGKMGFGGKLTSREIVDQVLFVQRYLKEFDQKVTNVVFMGMGEPMLNLPNVGKAIGTMTDPERLGMSMRRITISTSGYARQLRQFIERGFRGRIAISLHAPNQNLREQLMPVAKQVTLDELFEVLDWYTQLTNKRISYEYILIDGITDTPKAAKELIALFRHRLAHINLIPYNPIKGAPYKRPSKNSVRRFSELLTNRGISNTIRVTMGDDVAAACGQLAAAQN